MLTDFKGTIDARGSSCGVIHTFVHFQHPHPIVSFKPDPSSLASCSRSTLKAARKQQGKPPYILFTHVLACACVCVCACLRTCVHTSDYEFLGSFHSCPPCPHRGPGFRDTYPCFFMVLTLIQRVLLPLSHPLAQICGFLLVDP